LLTPPQTRGAAPTAEELRDLADVAQQLREEHRTRSRRRFLLAIVTLTLASGLWMSRAEWLPLVTSTDPYQATPAAHFPVGEAGIVLPPAADLPNMSAAKVGDALERVKRALVASYLDNHMLTGHRPDQVLALLAPDSAKVVRPLFDRGGYGTAMVRLAPGSTLAGPPRVSGKIKFSQLNWRGMPALDVTTNYVWVYALNSPPGVVVIHSATHWMFPLGHNLLPTSRGMYLGRTTGYWQGMDCTASARGLTAAAPNHDKDANPNFSDSDPDAYFDPHRSVRVGAGCR
jgi:hypothetical protein